MDEIPIGKQFVAKLFHQVAGRNCPSGQSVSIVYVGGAASQAKKDANNWRKLWTRVL